MTKQNRNVLLCRGCNNGCSMPSQTVAFEDSQYQYILATKDGNVSERVRELVDKGMEMEENDE